MGVEVPRGVSAAYPSILLGTGGHGGRVGLEHLAGQENQTWEKCGDLSLNPFRSAVPQLGILPVGASILFSGCLLHGNAPRIPMIFNIDR